MKMFAFLLSNTFGLASSSYKKRKYMVALNATSCLCLVDIKKSYEFQVKLGVMQFKFELFCEKKSFSINTVMF